MEPNEISKQELQSYQHQYQTRNSIGDLTPSLCQMLGIRVPKQCGATAIPEVVDQAERLTGGEGRIQKALVFAPDAIGEVQRSRFPEELERVHKIAGFQVKSTSVMPSVTPVCFGTIFSGASPQVHGIQQYAKPVLTIETIFDTLAEAGKNVAIVTTNNTSIDKIFRDRKVDYYSTRTDQLSFQTAQRLLLEDDYDFIVLYFGSYDSASHHNGPWSETAVNEMKRAIAYFEEVNQTVEKVWKQYNRTLVWAPDHGNHQIDELTGGHGENIPDDMIVNHFYRVRKANQ